MAEIGTALILLLFFFLMWFFTSPEDVREEFENEIREGILDGSIERGARITNNKKRLFKEKSNLAQKP